MHDKLEDLQFSADVAELQLSDALLDAPLSAGAREAAEGHERQDAKEATGPRARAPKPSAATTQAAANETEPDQDDTAEVPGVSGSVTLRVQPHLGARVLIEALPSPAWVGALGLELALDPQFSLDFSALASLLTSTPFQGGRVESQLFGAELLGCSSWYFLHFAVHGCLGVALAACSARGLYYVNEARATLLWAAPLARIALRWPKDEWISLRLALHAHVNVVRPQLAVTGADTPLNPGWVGGSLGLDLLVAFE